jgi:hypothetical protein
MTTYIQYKDGKQKEVKNLGWLARNITRVEGITISDRNDGAKCGCQFVATLSGGDYYHTAFNSYDVCKDWIASRRGLKNVRVIDLVDLI